MRILLFIIGLVLLCLLISVAGRSDRKDCEERIAEKLNTTAVYIDGKCMVKGYGRFNGR